MIGWREEGRRWNPVASGEREEHHAYSGHQETSLTVVTWVTGKWDVDDDRHH